jgi:hypothetical protein
MLGSFGGFLGATQDTKMPTDRLAIVPNSFIPSSIIAFIKPSDRERFSRTWLLSFFPGVKRDLFVC